MILILAATRGEARLLLKYLDPVKKDGVYHFRGNIGGQNAALYLTRPGVDSPAGVRRFLRLYKPDLVISTGACASLTSELARYAPVKITEITAPGEGLVQLGPGGLRSVTVQHLVTDDKTKAGLRQQTGADVLDMESYALAKIFQEQEFAALQTVIVRVVDDLPGEESYLEQEKKLREWTLRTPSGRLKWRDKLRFGLWDYLCVLRRRGAVARAIFQAVQAAMLDQKR